MVSVRVTATCSRTVCMVILEKWFYDVLKQSSFSIILIKFDEFNKIKFIKNHRLDQGWNPRLLTLSVRHLNHYTKLSSVLV